MARLIPPENSPQSGTPEPMTSEHTVGRSSSCRLRLVDPEVSGHHAVIRWTGEAWELRDLGSRNGTWANGKRVDPGRKRVLEVGDRLAFGQELRAWEVADLTPPEPMARNSDGRWLQGDDGLLLLPDAESATACIFEEGGHWIAELEPGPRRLEDGAEISVNGQSFSLFLPERVASTREAGGGVVDLSRATLHFKVSMDEEHVELDLIDGETRLTLPHRAHLYLVLDLARARLEDAKDADLPESEQGWRYNDVLMSDHRIPVNQFNVVLFRARRQLKRADVLGADEKRMRLRHPGNLRSGGPGSNRNRWSRAE